MSVHLSKAKQNPSQSYKNIWINQLWQAGRRPQVRIICVASVTETEAKYIQLCKAKGMRLLNMTHNGKAFGPNGGHFISQTEVERIRASLGLPFTTDLF